MSLFLDEDSYEFVQTKESSIVPINKLTNNGYIGYYQYNILCECELSKLFHFFKTQTSNSKKNIKRIRINDLTSANIISSRLMSKFNKKFVHKNNRQYVFKQMSPVMEIIEWPENTFIDKTFNMLTKNKYIENNNTLYGTFIIPLVKTGCSTTFGEVGEDGVIEIASCECSLKCLHNKNKCPCAKGCNCHLVTLHITEGVNFFYTSDLEPIDIIGPPRINLYIHLEYKIK